MPLTLADIKSTFSEEISEQIADVLDTLQSDARVRPLATVVLAFVLGLFAGHGLASRFAWLKINSSYWSNPTA